MGGDSVILGTSCSGFCEDGDGGDDTEWIGRDGGGPNSNLWGESIDIFDKLSEEIDFDKLSGETDKVDGETIVGARYGSTMTSPLHQCFCW